MTQDLSTLRQKSGDSSVFNNLMQSDPVFRAKVERVQEANPNMSPFEKVKFPSAMLDLHQGVSRKLTPEMDRTSTMVNRGMTEPSPFNQGLGSYLGQTAKNIIPSTGNLIAGVGNAIIHPFQTGKSLIQLGVGGAANTLESIASIAGVKNAEEIFDLSSEEVASAVGDFYVQRYGSIEKAATTLRDDPAGFLSDLGAVVTGVGGAIKGGAMATGAVTGAATRSATALTAVGRGVRTAEAVGSALIKQGINMEPLVITGRGVILAGGKVKSVVGGALSAEKQMATALKLHPSLNRKFMEPTMASGKTPARYAIEKGVTGKSVEEVAEKFQKIAQKSKDAVDSGLAQFRQKYDIISEVPAARQILMEILKKYEASPVGNEQVIAHVKNLLNMERMSLTELNGIKRMASDAFKLFEGAENVAGKQGLENLYRSVQGFIEEQAALKGFADVGILNKDTQLSTFMKRALEKSATSRYGNNILSLRDAIIGSSLAGGGFAVGSGGLGFFAAAGILLTKRILGSVRFKTTFAKYMSRITPAQRRALEQAVKTGKHTKDSRMILRRVTASTAEDIKNYRIGESEVIPPQSTAGQLSGSRTSMVQESTSPTTLPPETSPVNSPKALPRKGAVTGERVTAIQDDAVRALDVADDAIRNSGKIAKNELQSILKPFVEMRDEMLYGNNIKDFNSGKSLASDLLRLKAKRAFDFTSKDIAGNVDSVQAARDLLRRASEYHAGKPIESSINDLMKKLENWQPSGEVEAIFEDGLRAGFNPVSDAQSILEHANLAIKEGYIHVDDVVTINGKAYTFGELIKNYEEALSLRQEKSLATRAKTARAKSGGDIAQNDGGTKAVSMTSAEKASLTPEEKATGYIGGSDSVPKLDSLNPTGGIYANYTPEMRAKMPLGNNMTTLDKTMGKNPNDMVTIYRGATNGQKDIVAGDFITTNKQLAKDYAGDGVVLEKKVKLSDVLDDATEPLGEEYIYRPASPLEPLMKEARVTTDIRGDTVEMLLAKKATATEIKNSAMRQRIMGSLPERAGYEIVYKAYPKEEAGFYYTKKLNQANQ